MLELKLTNLHNTLRETTFLWMMSRYLLPFIHQMSRYYSITFNVTVQSSDVFCFRNVDPTVAGNIKIMSYDR